MPSTSPFMKNASQGRRSGIRGIKLPQIGGGFKQCLVGHQVDGSKSSTLMVRRRLSSARRSRSASAWLMTPRLRPASATLSSWVKGVCSFGFAHLVKQRLCGQHIVQRLFQQPEGVASSRVRYWPSARRLRSGTWHLEQAGHLAVELVGGTLQVATKGSTMARRARPIQRFGKLRSNSSIAS